jgi:hypothetical protein
MTAKKDPLTTALAARRDADAQVAAAVAGINDRFASAKAARQANPDDAKALAAYEAARDELQAYRAVDRADRSPAATITVEG